MGYTPRYYSGTAARGEYVHSFVVKHVKNNVITFSHLSAKNAEEARWEVQSNNPGTNVIYVKEI